MFVFFYDGINPSELHVEGPLNSVLIYQPDKRHQLWRFVSYATLHAGWAHLTFNTIVQVLLGLPLEMVHGSTRVACIYLAGVAAGSLGTSVFDADVYLVGASGGVYALIAAHLANILVNYSSLQFALVRTLAVAFLAITDMGFAMYDFSTGETSGLPVSYIAHMSGALAGLMLGLVMLKNFTQKSKEGDLFWWISLGVFTACMAFAIIFNLLHPFPYIGIGQSLA